ncbi:DUF3237 domain-containing protein [Microbacterium oleivorans]|uniref:DUF3237 domain-containing protein n=1 Tax=Microbacterium oleivorans TaxID=273677 RepID=UPI00204269E3|nr:DUF3237 domain-containing protein [Microbacterium oleivorans]MCM3695100.1 DUF3237 domain-containing protein [Microbacterium oleivorans]
MTVADPVVPTLEPAFHAEIIVGPPGDLGTTRVGHRRIVPVLGGTLTGGLAGEILPGGADWQTVRADGAIEIDCRYTARTDAGALVYLQVTGVRSGAPAVLESLLRGDPVDPSEYYFRTAIRFETSAPDLLHLQDSIYVASCVRTADRVRYDTFRVS